MPSEGYVPCACEECFEIAIGKAGEALCNDCRVAGCTPNAGEGFDECHGHTVRCLNCGAYETSPKDCEGCEYNLNR